MGFSPILGEEFIMGVECLRFGSDGLNLFNV